MKVIAINGSPRKNWNTAIMLQSALEGAKSDMVQKQNSSTSMTTNIKVASAAWHASVKVAKPMGCARIRMH